MAVAEGEGASRRTWRQQPAVAVASAQGAGPTSSTTCARPC